MPQIEKECTARRWYRIAEEMREKQNGRKDEGKTYAKNEQQTSLFQFDNQPSSVRKDGKGAKDTKDHNATKDSKATDATLIDELFRQATELFE